MENAEINKQLKNLNATVTETCDALEKAVTAHSDTIIKTIYYLFFALALLIGFLLLNTFYQPESMETRVVYASIVPQALLYMIVIIRLVYSSGKLKERTISRTTELMNITSSVAEEIKLLTENKCSEIQFSLSCDYIQTLSREIAHTASPKLKASEMHTSAMLFIYISIFTSACSFIFLMSPSNGIPLYVVSYIGLLCAISSLIIVSFRPVSIAALEATYDILASALATLGSGNLGSFRVPDESKNGLMSNE